MKGALAITNLGRCDETLTSMAAVRKLSRVTPSNFCACRAGTRGGRRCAAMSSALLAAVRGLHVAEPSLGVKPLLARLREQQPDLEAG